MNISFFLESNSSNPQGPRAGQLITTHGTIATPAFMPVGTLASVKALAPEDVLSAQQARLEFGGLATLIIISDQ